MVVQAVRVVIAALVIIVVVPVIVVPVTVAPVDVAPGWRSWSWLGLSSARYDYADVHAG